MANWAKPVDVAAIEDGQEYFLGKNVAAKDYPPLWIFYATGINGKSIMSQKPGIARRFVGSDSFRKILSDQPTLSAIQVPADAEKRWKRRAKLFNLRKGGAQ